MPGDAQPTAIGVRLPLQDAQLLSRLAKDLRGTQASTVAMALRHLAETIRRGAAVYVDTQWSRSDGPSPRALSRALSGSFHLIEVMANGAREYRFMVAAPAERIPREGEILQFKVGEGDFSEAAAFRVTAVRHQLAEGPDPSSSAPLVVRTCFVEAHRVVAAIDEEVPGGIRVIDDTDLGQSLFDDERHIPSPVVGGGSQSAPLVVQPPFRSI